MVPTYWSAKHVMLPRVKKSQVSTPSCPDWSAQTERNMRSTETPGSPHTSAARRQLEGAVVLFVKGQHGRPNKLSHGHIKKVFCAIEGQKQWKGQNVCKREGVTWGLPAPQCLTPTHLYNAASTPKWCAIAMLQAMASFWQILFDKDQCMGGGSTHDFGQILKRTGPRNLRYPKT